MQYYFDLISYYVNIKMNSFILSLFCQVVKNSTNEKTIQANYKYLKIILTGNYW